MDKRSVQSEISSYIGKLLRDNFGKGPSSVFVSIEEPYITIYLKGFLAPMEKVLVNQNNTSKVEETRDLLMQELIPDIKATLRATAGIEVESLYYDWSLSNRSGMIVGIMNVKPMVDENNENYEQKQTVHDEIEKITRHAQKEPEMIRSFLLNDRTLIIEREGIFVAIEKEMIRLGFHEQLKIAKRHLEKRLLHLSSFESILQTRIEDVFLDWDFNLDRSYIIFIFKPTDLKS
ncbi:DUF2294 domain-containing protein [Halobacillus mangrovi]|uniref:Na+-translocating membrane potential-generating system MpsC domain-containing protein n=1 Tax=Halobacillus mangrovi TaxID=402384 RepID=A0A1W5ZS27_9BACI|nr:Na-translocating system protein MpsC family protein [Halobacillus mangrovi]ARI76057.1 hypothetical protein HM131_04055 [Halobacillus mangrovi]